MPRPPKPWYWKARKGWYVYIGKEKTPLGRDKDEAIRRFPEIMGKPKEVRQPAPEGSIAIILDDFLARTYENRSKETADCYKDFLQSFAAKYGRMRVSDLHSGHVTA